MGMPKVKNIENTNEFRTVCQISGRTYCKFIGLPKQCLLELSTPIRQVNELATVDKL